MLRVILDAAYEALPCVKCKAETDMCKERLASSPAHLRPSSVSTPRSTVVAQGLLAASVLLQLHASLGQSPGHTS